MVTAIVGSRDFDDYPTFFRMLFYLSITEDLVIASVISGGAAGVDLMAERWAREHHLPFTEYPADWNSHGKAAGPMRNRQMVDAADLVLAFWDGYSRGTKSTIDYATGRKRLIVVTVDTS